MKSALGFTHFTSDPHYAHANIISFVGRPFADVDHQIAELVRRFNLVVGPDDHTLFLGDLFLPAKYDHVIRDMHGRKTLVAGNHDDSVTTTKLLRMGFERVERGCLYDEIGGVRVCYCHFPPANPEVEVMRYPERRPPREPGTVIIHGHTHEMERATHYGTVHVGVDAWDYGPATCAEVAALVLGLDLEAQC